MRGTSTTRTYVYVLGIVWSALMLGLVAGGWSKLLSSYKKAGVVVRDPLGHWRYTIGIYCLMAFPGAAMVYFIASMAALSSSRRNAFNIVMLDIIVLSALTAFGLGSVIYNTMHMPVWARLIALIKDRPSLDRYADSDYALLSGLKMLFVSVILGWWLIVNLAGVLVVIIMGARKRRTLSSVHSVWTRTAYELDDLAEEWVKPGRLLGRGEEWDDQPYMAVNPDVMFQIPVRETQLDDGLAPRGSDSAGASRASLLRYDTPVYEGDKREERESTYGLDSRVSYSHPEYGTPGFQMEPEPIAPIPAPAPAPALAGPSGPVAMPQPHPSTVTTVYEREDVVDGAELQPLVAFPSAEPRRRTTRRHTTRQPESTR